MISLLQNKPAHMGKTKPKQPRKVRVTADAVQIEPIIVAPIVAMPMLLVLLIILLIPKPRRRYD